VTKSGLSRHDRFFWWIFGIAAASMMFIWALGTTLQDYSDYYYSLDLNSLRPTEAIVTSFVKTVHYNSPDRPKKISATAKWIKPASIALIGDSSAWQRKVISEHAALLSKLTGLEINFVDADDSRANLKIFFVSGTQAIMDTGNKYLPHFVWDRKYVGDGRCFLTIYKNKRKEIPKAVIIIGNPGQDSDAHRCLIEELTQVFGPSHDNATYQPTLFTNYHFPYGFSINDKILVRTLYDKRIKPGMTSAETAPLARQIITELVAAVKEKGEEALYQK